MSVTFSKFVGFIQPATLPSFTLYTPPWLFSTFLKLYKWYQIVQSVCAFLCNQQQPQDQDKAMKGYKFDDSKVMQSLLEHIINLLFHFRTLQYIDKNNQESFHNYDTELCHLKKKKKLLDYFNTYMSDHLVNVCDIFCSICSGSRKSRCKSGACLKFTRSASRNKTKLWMFSWDFPETFWLIFRISMHCYCR